ncbi:DUF4362 domain-containing protein [Paenibacillus sp. YAF4_2]|uniref:DUF4362 domain-containing protein n=1 Tax=Paenibacillus sp. YAF4_2 TaxID=3233085 RepID=UPI003F98569D
MKPIVILTVFTLLIAGCSNQNGHSSGGSKPYSYEEAISKGDVVFFNDVHNVEKFNQFLTDLGNKKVSSIRVTGYTDEGDPIFKDLKFDGEVIHYTYDDSNDKFGGTQKGVRTDTCSEVTSENVEEEVQYTLSGCTTNDSEMSYFLLRTKKE